MMDLSTIEKRIYVVRGIKVILDSDLAELYGVETKRLNEAVKRNVLRFPEDFMFSLTTEELVLLIKLHPEIKYLELRNVSPHFFTENGIAMLSSVLNSERAIQINIQIMRIFTKLRSYLLLEENLSNRIDKLEVQTGRAFKLVFEEIKSIKDQVRPRLNPDRKKIGLK